MMFRRWVAIGCVCAPLLATAALHEMFPQEEAGKGMAAMAREDEPLRARHGHAVSRTESPAVQDQAVYPFFGDATFTTTVVRVSQGYGGTEIVEGRETGSDVVSLSIYAAGGERHEVRSTGNGRVYLAVSSPDGALAVQEHDPSLEPQWGEHVAMDEPMRQEGEKGVAGHVVASSVIAPLAGETIIDVMMVFDTTAASWANNNAGGVVAYSEAAVQRMNVALANSGIDCVMRLADTYCPDYTYGGNLSAALSALQSSAGDLSGVAAARNACGADVVSMMVDTGSASGTTGIGYISAPATHVGASYAFSVCSVRSVNTTHTMSHEIGHNLGCDHSKYQLSSPAPSSTYAAGWYFTGNNSVKYHTVMAYNSDGYGGYYSACDYFSTPLKTHQGVAVGDTVDGDNARCIRENMAAVASYRNPPSGLPAPTGVSATQGTYPDR
ncbi:MAG: zinc-dependent metalloprotease, partial [Kiritimatiellaeota bacterium]|nr:zinc-dependent metalloprotease [Kiritimatiellota bacterium]